MENIQESFYIDVVLKSIVSQFSINILRDRKKFKELVFRYYTDNRLKQYYLNIIESEHFINRIFIIMFTPLDERRKEYEELVKEYVNVNYLAIEFAKKILDSFITSMGILLDKPSTRIDDYDYDYNVFIEKDEAVYSENKTRLLHGETSHKQYRIADGVIAICDKAFSDNSNIEDVSFPSSVLYIGSSSFSNCVNLRTVVLPDDLLSIGDSVFYECRNLQSIIIPDNVKIIERCSFYGCRNLRKVVFPKNILRIEYSAFLECFELDSVVLPSSLISIDEYAFSCCNLKSIILPSKLEIIGNFAFDGCSFKYVEIPANVSYIGNYAFSHCYDMVSVIFQSEELEIGEDVFYRCEKLETIIIPYGTTEKFKHRMPEYKHLFKEERNIYCINDSSSIKNVLRYLINKYGSDIYLDKKELWNNILSLYTGPEKYKSLIKELIEKDIIIRLYNISFETYEKRNLMYELLISEFNYSDFYDTNIIVNIFKSFLESLNVSIGDAISNIAKETDGEWLDERLVKYSSNRNKLLKAPIAFMGKYNIKYGTIVICNNAFELSIGLENIIIPESVISIGHEAFKHCCGLVSIFIPKSVVIIGYSAFQNCKNLKTVISVH